MSHVCTLYVSKQTTKTQGKTYAFVVAPSHSSTDSRLHRFHHHGLRNKIRRRKYTQQKVIFLLPTARLSSVQRCRLQSSQDRPLHTVLCLLKAAFSHIDRFDSLWPDDTGASFRRNFDQPKPKSLKTKKKHEQSKRELHEFTL